MQQWPRAHLPLVASQAPSPPPRPPCSASLCIHSNSGRQRGVLPFLVARAPWPHAAAHVGKPPEPEETSPSPTVRPTHRGSPSALPEWDRGGTVCGQGVQRGSGQALLPSLSAWLGPAPAWHPALQRAPAMTCSALTHSQVTWALSYLLPLRCLAYSPLTAPSRKSPTAPAPVI